MKKPASRFAWNRPEILLGLIMILILPASRLFADDLFLGGGRFRVASTWRTPDGRTGQGHGVSLSSDSGYFWFFSSSNVEMVVKVLDACALPSQRFWFFAAGLTNVEVEIEVEDVFAGAARRYTNPAGRAFVPIQDTNAFATCSIERTCGQGSAAEIAATPRADASLEAMGLFLSPGITVRQETYDRLVADTGAIETLYPQLSSANFLPRFDPGSLIVGLTPMAAAAARTGGYHEWDCLSHWYGVNSTEVFPDLDFAVLRFRGRFRTDRFIPDYEAVPGISSAEVNSLSLPPLPIDRLCVAVDGKVFHYFYELRTSQPVSTWHFITATPGVQPTLSHRLDGPWPQPLPDWLASFSDCLQKNSAE